MDNKVLDFLKKVFVDLDWVRNIYYQLGGRKFLLGIFGVVAITLHGKFNPETAANTVSHGMQVLGIALTTIATILGIAWEDRNKQAVIDEQNTDTTK